MQNKVAFVTCYFGKLPDYFPYFLKSCFYNKNFTFYIFTNNLFNNSNLPENVKIIQFSLSSFNNLASQKLGVVINVENPYKLCDFKPAYGIIFSEYLTGFDFWGGTDLDVIFGNLLSVINDEFLNSYDFISSVKEYTSGSFFIFRNNKKCNHLFEESPDYKKVFTDVIKNYAFDECALFWKELKKGQELNSIKTEIVSLTHIIFDHLKKKDIRAFFNNINVEPDGVHDWILFKEGKLFLLNNQIMMIHLIFLKTKYYFILPHQHDWRKIPDNFFIRSTGIYFSGNKKNFNYWFSSQRIRIIKTKISNILNKLRKYFKN